MIFFVYQVQCNDIWSHFNLKRCKWIRHKCYCQFYWGQMDISNYVQLEGVYFFCSCSIRHSEYRKFLDRKSISENFDSLKDSRITELPYCRKGRRHHQILEDYWVQGWEDLFHKANLKRWIIVLMLPLIFFFFEKRSFEILVPCDLREKDRISAFIFFSFFLCRGVVFLSLVHSKWLNFALIKKKWCHSTLSMLTYLSIVEPCM